jgi:hypothetical protein
LVDGHAAQESPSKASALATAIKQKRQQRTEESRRQSASWMEARDADELGDPMRFDSDNVELGEEGEGSNGSEDDEDWEPVCKGQVSKSAQGMLDTTSHQALRFHFTVRTTEHLRVLVPLQRLGTRLE